MLEMLENACEYLYREEYDVARNLYQEPISEIIKSNLSIEHNPYICHYYNYGLCLLKTGKDQENVLETMLDSAENFLKSIEINFSTWGKSKFQEAQKLLLSACNEITNKILKTLVHPFNSQNFNLTKELIRIGNTSIIFLNKNQDRIYHLVDRLLRIYKNKDPIINKLQRQWVLYLNWAQGDTAIGENNYEKAIGFYSNAVTMLKNSHLIDIWTIGNLGDLQCNIALIYLSIKNYAKTAEYCAQASVNYTNVKNMKLTSEHLDKRIEKIKMLQAYIKNKNKRKSSPTIDENESASFQPEENNKQLPKYTKKQKQKNEIDQVAEEKLVSNILSNFADNFEPAPKTSFTSHQSLLINDPLYLCISEEIKKNLHISQNTSFTFFNQMNDESVASDVSQTIVARFESNSM